MKIAVAQVCTDRDVAANLDLVAAKVAEAADAGAELVVLPEATMRAFGHNLTEIAEPLDGPFATRVRALAREHRITVVLGMFTPGDGEKVRNTLLIAGPDADASYGKVHLFDAFGFKESDTVDPGEGLTRFEVGGETVGVATCYDVRFPQLFIEHARAGARVQIVCASWGSGRGKAEQWDLLVRARALDSTSFVVACGQADPAQSGVEAKEGAPTGIGHSQVVSPMGEVLAKAEGAPELLVVDIDPAEADRAREAIPVLVNAKLS
ncbi:carbon-nitrogen hydrolase family protein [Mariniluteicoccus flavus]